MEKKTAKFIKKLKENKLLIFLFEPLWSKITSYHKNKQFIKNGEKVLLAAKSYLESDALFFWLDFGTLLGAYREKDFIKHDLDLDIAVFHKDREKVEKCLLKHGFTLHREFKIKGKEGSYEQTFICDNVTIDIFYYFLAEKTIYCNTFSPFDAKEEMPKNQFQVKKITLPYTGFTKYTFKGESFNIPSNVEEYLKANYGDDFMTPNPNFNYKKEATNIYYYPKDDKIGVYYRYY